MNLADTGDIRAAYPVEQLAWVRIEKLGQHNQRIPSPSSRIDGGYVYGADGVEFIAHIDDIQVWPTVFVRIEDREVEPLAAPAAAAAPVTASADNTAPDPPNQNGSAPGADLVKIKGIGKAAADKLIAAGIGNVEALAAATPAALVAALGKPMNAENAQKIIDAANEELSNG